MAQAMSKDPIADMFKKDEQKKRQRVSIDHARRHRNKLYRQPAPTVIGEGVHQSGGAPKAGDYHRDGVSDD